MNATHIHLLLNHFPIIGSLIGSAILLWGIFKKQDNIKSIAAATLFIMAILAIPVFITGEPAEESVEKLSGVSENMIDLHEEAAELSIWLMEITGLIALAAFFLQWKKNNKAGISFNILLISAIISFAAMARTGYYGGQIRHTELTTAAATANSESNDKKSAGEAKDSASEKGEGNKEKEEKDDD